MNRRIKYLVVIGVGAWGCTHNALKPSEQDLQQIAAKLIPQIEARAAEYGFSQDDSWVLRNAPLIDELGRVVSRFDRLHAGLRVAGGDVITHSKLDDALRVERFVSRLTKPLGVPLQPQVTDTAAKAIASGTQPQGEATHAELVLWAVDAFRQSPRLAWDVKVGARHLLVAADNGKVLDEYSNILTAECGDGLLCAPATIRLGTAYTPRRLLATGTRRRRSDGSFLDYALHDTGRQIRVLASSFTRADADRGELIWLLGWVDATPGTTVSVPGNRFGNGQIYDGRDPATSSDQLTAAADLFANLGRVYGYFADTFGRFGFNGWQTVCLFPQRPCRIGERPVEATVNVPTRNAAYDNTSQKLWFGYDRRTSPSWGPLVELDIVAHEFTHGITMHSARLLGNQHHSGALNESMSDVFGRVTTFHVQPSSFDSEQAWWIGAQANTPTVPRDAPLRYLDEPTRDGHSLAHLSDFPAGGIDPHYGAGIPNRVFANLAQVIGWRNAANIWYRALTTCFTESTTFYDARTCTLTAAIDLYPHTGTYDDMPNTPRSVALVWAEVGVF